MFAANVAAIQEGRGVREETELTRPGILGDELESGGTSYVLELDDLLVPPRTWSDVGRTQSGMGGMRRRGTERRPGDRECSEEEDERDDGRHPPFP